MEMHLANVGTKLVDKPLAHPCERSLAGGTPYVLQLVSTGVLFFAISFGCIDGDFFHHFRRLLLRLRHLVQCNFGLVMIFIFFFRIHVHVVHVIFSVIQI